MNNRNCPKMDEKMRIAEMFVLQNRQKRLLVLEILSR